MAPEICRIGRAFLIGSLGAFLCACGQTEKELDDSITSAMTSSLERIVALEVKVYTLTTEIKALNTRLEISEALHKSAVFDPTDSSYSRIDAPSGFGEFAVSVDDVQPLGDGVRLKMRFGNVSSAAFSDVKLQLKYGPRTPEFVDGGGDLNAQFATYNKNFDAWKESLKTKEVALTDTLKPGSWNPVTITLPQISADKFGYLEVSLTTNRIYLAR